MKYYLKQPKQEEKNIFHININKIIKIVIKRKILDLKKIGKTFYNLKMF
jgi:hypothetical protein